MRVRPKYVIPPKEMKQPTESKQAKITSASKKPTRPATPPSDSITLPKQTIDDYKDKIKELMYNNKELQEQQRIQEQDSLEIIKSIQSESDIKDRKVIVLEKQLDRLKHDMEKERIQVIKMNEDKFSGYLFSIPFLILELLNEIHEKDVAFGALQGEIGQMKDFKKKKFELMQEVERQKQELVDTEQRHQELMSSLGWTFKYYI